MTAALPHVGQIGNAADSVTRLIAAMNKSSSALVNELRWLASLAPAAPDVPPQFKGSLVPLNYLVENTE